MVGETGGGVRCRSTCRWRSNTHRRCMSAIWNRTVKSAVKGQTAKRPWQMAKRFRSLPPQWICKAGQKICRNRSLLACSDRNAASVDKMCSNTGRFQRICSDFCSDSGSFTGDFPSFYLRKEAGAGIEPANSGFADRDLTTWLPRRALSERKLSGARSDCQCSTLFVIRCRGWLQD